MTLVLPDVWTRRQALAAALEQETEPGDLRVLARWLDDPKLGVARALWRFGAAAWSLARFGGERSLDPLRHHAEALGEGSPFGFYTKEAIEARLRPDPSA